MTKGRRIGPDFSLKPDCAVTDTEFCLHLSFLSNHPEFFLSHLHKMLIFGATYSKVACKPVQLVKLTAQYTCYSYYIGLQANFEKPLIVHLFCLTI